MYTKQQVFFVLATAVAPLQFIAGAHGAAVELEWQSLLGIAEMRTAQPWGWNSSRATAQSVSAASPRWNLKDSRGAAGTLPLAKSPVRNGKVSGA